MIHSVLAAALVVGSLASPSAAPSSDTKSKVVDYADLDLSSSAGLKALHRRIGVAIADVCGEAGPASHEEVIDIERCVPARAPERPFRSRRSPRGCKSQAARHRRPFKSNADKRPLLL